MNIILIVSVIALLVALAGIRTMRYEILTLECDKKWAWDQFEERNVRLIILSAKHDKLLGANAQLEHRRNELAKTVQNQAAELRRQHRRVVQ